MNYIFESNINFYDELKKELMEMNEDNKEINGNIKNNNENNNENNDENKCLITNEPLTIHYITLPCHHKFNYIPLYKTILLQKKQINHLELNTLLPKQIQCPYCRCKHNKLLPYIPLEPIARVLGVNSPSTLSMEYKGCEWVYKSGKKKNTNCNHNAYYDITNNSNINTLAPSEISKLVSYCFIHWAKYNEDKNSVKELNKFEWTDEMAELFNSNTIASLKDKLRKANLKLVGNKKELIKRYISWYKNPQ